MALRTILTTRPIARNPGANTLTGSSRAASGTICLRRRPCGPRHPVRRAISELGAAGTSNNTTLPLVRPAVRVGVDILGGRVLTEDQGYGLDGLDGLVAPSGAARVAVLPPHSRVDE